MNHFSLVEGLCRWIFYCTVTVLSFSTVLHFQRTIIKKHKDRDMHCVGFFCHHLHRVPRLFHLNVTCSLLALHCYSNKPVKPCHFHIHMNYTPLNRRLVEPSGQIGDEVGLISHSRVSSILRFIRFTKEVLFHWWEQSIDHCYQDESNSIKRALHLGPQKEGLSEASSEGSAATIHRQLWEERMNPADNLFPFFLSPACLVLNKRNVTAIIWLEPLLLFLKTVIG